tara:strand:- start:448 stop:639 length:192 start_codon:yes stop_codon:yes gene_type:complete
MYDYEGDYERAFEKWLAENTLKSYTESEVFDETVGWMNVVTQVHLDGTIEMFNDYTKQMMMPL